LHKLFIFNIRSLVSSELPPNDRQKEIIDHLIQQYLKQEELEKVERQKWKRSSSGSSSKKKKHEEYSSESDSSLDSSDEENLSSLLDTDDEEEEVEAAVPSFGVRSTSDIDSMNQIIIERPAQRSSSLSSMNPLMESKVSEFSIASASPGTKGKLRFRRSNKRDDGQEDNSTLMVVLEYYKVIRLTLISSPLIQANYWMMYLQ
jgi:hypothetical protein